MNELSFNDLPPDIHSCIFDFLPTKDIFNLMMVSKYIRDILTEDERFWNRRIQVHFSQKRIEAHGKNKRKLYLMIEMMKSPRSEIYIERFFKLVFQKRWILDSSGVDAIVKTLSKYIISISLQPFDQFPEIIKRDIPNSIANETKTHDLIINNFFACQSRTPLIHSFFIIMNTNNYFPLIVSQCSHFGCFRSCCNTDPQIVTNIHIYRILDIMLINVEPENPLLKLLDKQMEGIDRYICERDCEHILCKKRAQEALDEEF
jgi:hypothetical protein